MAFRLQFGRGGFGGGFGRKSFFGGGGTRGFSRGFGRGSGGGVRGRFWGQSQGGYGWHPDPQVQWAQGCLAQLVGPGVPQNGIMGPQTQQALQTFQSQQQLPPTGMLDPNTMNALQAACSGPPGPPPGPPMGEVGAGEQGEFPFDVGSHRGDRFRDHRDRWRRDRSSDHGRDHDRRWPFLQEAETSDAGQGEYRFHPVRVGPERRGWDHRFQGFPEQKRISWAQSCLAQILGSWVIQDGNYGPNTAAALRAFQEQRGLAVNGVLDDATAHSLHEACGG